MSSAGTLTQPTADSNLKTLELQFHCCSLGLSHFRNCPLSSFSPALHQHPSWSCSLFEATALNGTPGANSSCSQLQDAGLFLKDMCLQGTHRPPPLRHEIQTFPNSYFFNGVFSGTGFLGCWERTQVFTLYMGNRDTKKGTKQVQGIVHSQI